MKTINLELSKKLAPYLEGIKTEFIYNDMWWIEENRWNTKELNEFPNVFKTLTLEEAIDFLPFKIEMMNVKYLLEIQKRINIYYIEYFNTRNDRYVTNKNISWKTLIEAIEKMLEYLLDNKLL